MPVADSICEKKKTRMRMNRRSFWQTRRFSWPSVLRSGTEIWTVSSWFFIVARFSMTIVNLKGRSNGRVRVMSEWKTTPYGTTFAATDAEASSSVENFLVSKTKGISARRWASSRAWNSAASHWPRLTAFNNFSLTSSDDGGGQGGTAPSRKV